MPHIGYQEVELDNNNVKTAAEFTIPDGATFALLQAAPEGDVNITLDGTTSPGQSSGLILRTTMAPFQVLIEDFRNIKFARSSSGAQTGLHVSFVS